MDKKAWPYTNLGILFLAVVLAACTQPLLPGALSIPQPTADTGPFPGLAAWDLLVISDSSNMGVGEAYARLIEADRGVKVNLHDCWLGSMSIEDPLDLLRLDAEASCGGKWRDLVRDAEVIVLFGNPADSQPADGAWMGTDTWLGCVTGLHSDKNADREAFAAFKAGMVKSCSAGTFGTYKGQLGELYDRIFELRAGRPVILRATDFYVPVISDWQQEGVAEACGACLDNFAAAIHQVAAEHAVPVASSMDALNGADHRSDPRQKGYISGDGEHLSASGAELVAETLRSTGYAYAGK